MQTVICEIPLLRYFISMIPLISVCILTKNAARTLRTTLESVQAFPEVVILDNGSSDETLAIARTYANTKIYESPFIGFGPLRNKAAELAQYDWILSLDSDEVLAPSFWEEMRHLSLSPHLTYVFRRHNFYQGKRIRGCGWDPEYVPRLYHRQKICFSSSQVHEGLLIGQTHSLSSPLYHTPYLSTADFLAKMQHYSTLFAEQNQGKKRASFSIAILHAFYAFFRSYFLKRGLFCGKEGFLISLYNANTTLYKYLKLAELNDKRESL